MPATKVSWETEVPIFRHPLILKQLATAIGLPFGLVAVVLIATAGTHNRIYALYALGLISATLLLTVALVILLYGGKYAVGFVIDDIGIRCYTQKTHAKRNRALNNLTVILGLLARQPSVAGAGVLAAARQSVLVRWKRIRAIRYDDKTQTISVQGRYLETIAVFCTPANYEQIAAIIQSKTQAAAL